MRKFDRILLKVYLHEKKKTTEQPKIFVKKGVSDIEIYSKATVVKAEWHWNK